jgi:hypothetical protein
MLLFRKGILPVTNSTSVGKNTALRAGGYPEMKFWNGILAEVSGLYLESSQTLDFVWFSTLIFTFYKMLFANRLEFSCIADFFAYIFKTRVESGLFKNRQQDDSFVKLMSENSNSAECSQIISLNAVYSTCSICALQYLRLRFVMSTTFHLNADILM